MYSAVKLVLDLSCGLLAYGPNVGELFRRCGVYVARIMKGYKPNDLPIQRPEKFDLVINLKTAMASGCCFAPKATLASFIR
jgi:putative ABC transport system substrate-binding protein